MLGNGDGGVRSYDDLILSAIIVCVSFSIIFSRFFIPYSSFFYLYVSSKKQLLQKRLAESKNEG
jgi:hypothetical protein